MDIQARNVNVMKTTKTIMKTNVKPRMESKMKMVRFAVEMESASVECANVTRTFLDHFAIF